MHFREALSWNCCSEQTDKLVDTRRKNGQGVRTVQISVQRAFINVVQDLPRPHRMPGPFRSVPEDAIAAISPYLTEHIIRFGDYTLNLDRNTLQPDYGYTLKRATSAH